MLLHELKTYHFEAKSGEMKLASLFPRALKPLIYKGFRIGSLLERGATLDGVTGNPFESSIFENHLINY